jgi:hypothetical protein
VDAVNDTKRLILTVLLAAWVMAFAYAFVHFATVLPTGDGFHRGANRITGYLGWQGIAGLVALAVFAVGRGWPKGSGVRRLTWVPLALALAHVAAIVAVIIWAGFG